MANSKAKRGVSEGKAGQIHELVAECYVRSLEQMLSTNEFDTAMLRVITTWLANNDISVMPEASKHATRLAELLSEVDLPSIAPVEY